jgi:hypothetical protein
MRPNYLPRRGSWGHPQVKLRSASDFAQQLMVKRESPNPRVFDFQKHTVVFHHQKRVFRCQRTVFIPKISYEISNFKPDTPSTFRFSFRRVADAKLFPSNRPPVSQPTPNPFQRPEPETPHVPIAENQLQKPNAKAKQQAGRRRDFSVHPQPESHHDEVDEQ